MMGSYRNSGGWGCLPFHLRYEIEGHALSHDFQFHKLRNAPFVSADGTFACSTVSTRYIENLECPAVRPGTMPGLEVWKHEIDIESFSTSQRHADRCCSSCVSLLYKASGLFVCVVAPQMLVHICCIPSHVLFLFSGCCKIVAFSTGLQDRDITKGNHKRYSSFHLFCYKYIKNGMSKLFSCFAVHYLTELPWKNV